MRYRKLTLLFICNLLVYSTANGLLPLLPVYASGLGATPTLVGGLMAFAYLALASGTILTGTLIRKSRNGQWLFVVMALLCVLLNVWLGRVTSIWQLGAAMGLLWFCGGVVVALISVFTGLLSTKANRGKVFGLMHLALPLGALFGGTLVGWLVDTHGYAFMFSILSLLWLAVSLLGFCASGNLGDASANRNGYTSEKDQVNRLGAGFYSLCAAALLASVTVFAGRLGTSLTMEQLRFSPGVIANAAALGALFVVPVVPLLGVLSDRLGRIRILSLCYGLGTVGMLILNRSTQAWQFWLVAACISMASYAGNAIASALAADLLPPTLLSRGLPRLNAMGWIGGIVGFAVTGSLMESLGSDIVFVAIAILPAAAIVLLHLYRVRSVFQLDQAQPAP